MEELYSQISALQDAIDYLTGKSTLSNHDLGILIGLQMDKALLINRMTSEGIPFVIKSNFKSVGNIKWKKKK